MPVGGTVIQQIITHVGYFLGNRYRHEHTMMWLSPESSYPVFPLAFPGEIFGLNKKVMFPHGQRRQLISSVVEGNDFRYSG